MKAAIVIDNWKLKIFKQMLDKKGFKYKELPGPFSGLVTLDVTISNEQKFKTLVQKINDMARHSNHTN